MIWIVIAGLIVLAGVVAAGWLMWRDGGWREVVFVYGFTIIGLGVIAVFTITVMQGLYQMGWCPADECRLW